MTGDRSEAVYDVRVHPVRGGFIPLDILSLGIFTQVPTHPEGDMDVYDAMEAMARDAIECAGGDPTARLRWVIPELDL